MFILVDPSLMLMVRKSLYNLKGMLLKVVHAEMEGNLIYLVKLEMSQMNRIVCLSFQQEALLFQHRWVTQILLWCHCPNAEEVHQSFWTLLGNSTSKIKLNPDQKDMAQMKVEQIKSSVNLTFHLFQAVISS
ncbi:uncharacterized protein LOC122641931 isoform X2 [Telopea speciosissima]|uniref:uncharacterized protein LOC122641931 isoform X2 n=1 Tax=Telopea speciosissima TaxID=54955 RepID=UPI001CC6487B|nr:uncharacterized protein LOC122641931 isoform X2 [Telopea speciosissima]